MSFAVTHSESQPTGSGYVRQGDNFLRDLFKYVRERGGVDHNTFSDETGESDVWAHKQVGMVASASAPTTSATKSFLYLLDVGGVLELHWKDSAGSAQQLTSAGKWVGGITGEIKLWSGTIANIPTGWLLCNGSNSTPDLRNMFVVGAQEDDGGVAKTNVTGSLTQSGGNLNHTHPAGTLAIDGDHTHTIDLDSVFTSGTVTTKYIAYKDSSGTEATSASGDDQVIDGSTGNNTVLPPYYALAYIMKS